MELPEREITLFDLLDCSLFSSISIHPDRGSQQQDNLTQGHGVQGSCRVVLAKNGMSALGRASTQPVSRSSPDSSPAATDKNGHLPDACSGHATPHGHGYGGKNDKKKPSLGKLSVQREGIKKSILKLHLNLVFNLLPCKSFIFFIIFNKLFNITK